MSGPVPITMTDIEAYARYRQIHSPYERERLLTYLRALDQAWMNDHYSDKSKDRGGKDDSPKPAPRRPR